MARSETLYAYVRTVRGRLEWVPLVQEQWAGELDEGWSHRLFSLLPDTDWQPIPASRRADAERINRETVERFGELGFHVFDGRRSDYQARSALAERVALACGEVVEAAGISEESDPSEEVL